MTGCRRHFSTSTSLSPPEIPGTEVCSMYPVFACLQSEHAYGEALKALQEASASNTDFAVLHSNRAGARLMVSIQVSYCSHIFNLHLRSNQQSRLSASGRNNAQSYGQSTPYFIVHTHPTRFIHVYSLHVLCPCADRQAAVSPVRCSKGSQVGP